MMDSPLKKEARIVGIDDGPYIRGADRTIVVMTIYRLDGYIEGIISSHVTTDGNDSAERIADTLQRSKFKDQIRAILSDGACLAGFHVLDMDLLHEKMNAPVITVSDKIPHTDAISSALKENFTDWRTRLEKILDHKHHILELPHGKCFIREKGITSKMSDDIVRRCTVRGRTPEPIRISHMIASLIDHHENR